MVTASEGVETRSRPRNVFVLCTGRSGSVTFSHATGHMTNFTSGHETLAQRVGQERLAYPANHIEIDNRLAWFLGRLDEKFGKDAYYVHLTRDADEVARSYASRIDRPTSISGAYLNGILMRPTPADPVQVSRDFVDTVTTNIRAFLRDKPHQMTFDLAHAERDFRQFWAWIGADGDLDAALREWTIQHNASKPEKASTGVTAATTRSDEQGTLAWQGRRDAMYQHAVEEIVRAVGIGAVSMIDIASGRGSFLEQFDWIPDRVSLDADYPFASKAVSPVNAEFVPWKSDRVYDVATCLNVLENIPNPELFAKKLLEISEITVVAVRFAWKQMPGQTHLNGSVDGEKLRAWFGRKPNYSYRIAEVSSGARHLIHVYERGREEEWETLKQRTRATKA
jgi:hypothetical protein